MKRRRRKKRAIGGNLDSLLDTLTNVVGILVIVLVTVQLASQEAASRIAESVQKIDPVEIERSEAQSRQSQEKAAKAAAALKQAQAAPRQDAGQEIARLEARAAVALEVARLATARAIELEQKHLDDSAVTKRASEAARVEKVKLEAERKQADDRRAALAVELTKMPLPIKLPAKEVRLPAPRPAPTGAKEARVLCREGRIWLVDIPGLQAEAQKRAASVVRQKKLDPDGDDWLSDGKLFTKTFNESPIKSSGFELTIMIPGNRPEIVLKRLPGSGETAENTIKASGELARALRRVKPSEYFLRFFVWPDGFTAYLQVREFVGGRGFAAGWEPVGSPDEQRIGLGKYAIGPKPPPEPPKPPGPQLPPKPAPNLID